MCTLTMWGVSVPQILTLCPWTLPATWNVASSVNTITRFFYDVIIMIIANEYLFCEKAEALCHHQVTTVALVEPCTHLITNFCVANIHGSTWNPQYTHSSSYGFCTANCNKFFRSLHIIADTWPYIFRTIMDITGFQVFSLPVSDCFTLGGIFTETCEGAALSE